MLKHLVGSMVWAVAGAGAALATLVLFWLAKMYVWQVVQTELTFMAQHPAVTLVAVVVLGLVAFLGFRVGAR